MFIIITIDYVNGYCDAWIVSILQQILIVSTNNSMPCVCLGVGSPGGYGGIYIIYIYIIYPYTIQSNLKGVKDEYSVNTCEGW